MKIKLKEIISDFIVPMRDKPKVFDGHIPWCRIEDLDGKYLYRTKSNQYVSYDTINNMNLKVIPANSVLFTCSATIGVVAINKRDLCTNQTFIGLVPSEKITCDYLYYYLKLCKKQFQKLSSITTIPYISRRLFEEFEIELPEIDTQYKIASVLSSLDSKIELNNIINQELEKLSRKLYDYWFLQFDFPNEQGKPYKSSGGKMVWSEEIKRNIPKGWRVDSIEKCCSIIDCLHSKKSNFIFEDKKYYLLQLENIKDDGLLDLQNKYYVSQNEYKKWTSRIEVTDGDIIITNAGRVAATAQIPNGVRAGIGRNITAIRPKSINETYLFLSLQGADLRKQIIANTDSGAFFSSLNVKGIKKLFVIRPPKVIEDGFEQIVKIIRRKREINNYQNACLTELRDRLLPILMNGQLQVGNTGGLFRKEVANHHKDQAVIVALTKKILGLKYGEVVMQKTLFNFLAFNSALPKKQPHYNFTNYNYGTYSSKLTEELKSNPYLLKEPSKGGAGEVFGIHPDYKEEIDRIINKREDQKFIEAIESLLKIYKLPFINKERDKIELLNTVTKLIIDLQSSELNKIYKGMQDWKVEGRGNIKNKADKFSKEDTGKMLELMSKEGLIERLIL